jgi:hypothetical protein
MKSKEEIELLAKERYGSDLHLYAKQRDGFIEGYKAASTLESLFDILDKADRDLYVKHVFKKEEVLWDEAFHKYAADKNFHSNFVSWLKDNYTLTPKSK